MESVDTAALRARAEEHIRRLKLIPPVGDVTCLVSGGADSTCLWHALEELGYRVSALHVHHGLRGAEADEDARFCRDVFAAEVVRMPDGGATTEAALREFRYSVATDRLRATGHTASDQIETILLQLVGSGRARGIKALREDGVVRPLLPLWREETEAYCRAEGLDFRVDTSNRDTKRGLIREQILPLLRALHPAAESNLLALADDRPRLPRRTEEALLGLLASGEGSSRIDLGGGVQAAREYDRVWLEAGPVALEGSVRWGPWTIEADEPGLHVRGWRAGDRLRGRTVKVQDVFVNAKVPRSEREAWPLVVRGSEVVAIPGLVEAPGVKTTREER